MHSRVDHCPDRINSIVINCSTEGGEMNAYPCKNAPFSVCLLELILAVCNLKAPLVESFYYLGE